MSKVIVEFGLGQVGEPQISPATGSDLFEIQRNAFVIFKDETSVR